MKKRFGKNAVALGLTCLLLVASGLLVADVEDQFSDWSAPVNLGLMVNTAGNDSGPFLSKDGLSLYFNSDSLGGFGGLDIFVSHRASVDAPWGPPQNLGPNSNSSSNDFAPILSPDEHRLYFTSTRPGGFGGNDLYVSRRHNRRDDFGWQPAENLGSGINTFAIDAAAAYFEDDVTGTITLYFHSNRPGGMGASDIYASTLNPDETWGPPVLVEELSSPFDDGRPEIRHDGLEMFVDSTRPGSLGVRDLWVSTRASTSAPWSTPVNLGPVVNISSPGFAGGAGISFDGTELYFFSGRPGGFGAQDIWVSTRTKLPDPE